MSYRVSNICHLATADNARRQHQKCPQERDRWKISIEKKRGLTDNRSPVKGPWSSASGPKKGPDGQSVSCNRTLVYDQRS